ALLPGPWHQPAGFLDPNRVADAFPPHPSTVPGTDEVAPPLDSGTRVEKAVTPGASEVLPVVAKTAPNLVPPTASETSRSPAPAGVSSDKTPAAGPSVEGPRNNLPDRSAISSPPDSLAPRDGARIAPRTWDSTSRDEGRPEARLAEAEKWRTVTDGTGADQAGATGAQGAGQ